MPKPYACRLSLFSCRCVPEDGQPIPDELHAVMANINKNISPHTLRHSFATHLVENGADIQLVQHMMGHASITTTERYIHMSQRHLKDAISKFHPRSS